MPMYIWALRVIKLLCFLQYQSNQVSSPVLTSMGDLQTVANFACFYWCQNVSQVVAHSLRELAQCQTVKALWYRLIVM